MVFDEDTIKRFWSKVKRGADDECWEWQGSRRTAGYGYLIVNKKAVVATHISLTLAGFERHDGLYAMHACDNPPCVNPKHLKWGTQFDNMQDCAKKGRNAADTYWRKATHCHRGHEYDVVGRFVSGKKGFGTCKACFYINRDSLQERKKLEELDKKVKKMTSEQHLDEMLPVYATMRPIVATDDVESIAIECRYADGQKYAPVEVDCDEKGNALAEFICQAINTRATAPTASDEQAIDVETVEKWANLLEAHIEPLNHPKPLSGKLTIRFDNADWVVEQAMKEYASAKTASLQQRIVSLEAALSNYLLCVDGQKPKDIISARQNLRAALANNQTGGV